MYSTNNYLNHSQTCTQKSVNSRTICSSITHETSIGENFLGECQAEKRKARLATSLFPGSRESVPVAFRRMQNWCRFRARRRLYSRARAITGTIQGGESSSLERLKISRGCTLREPFDETSRILLSRFGHAPSAHSFSIDDRGNRIWITVSFSRGETRARYPIEETTSPIGIVYLPRVSNGLFYTTNVNQVIC